MQKVVPTTTTCGHAGAHRSRDRGTQRGDELAIVGIHRRGAVLAARVHRLVSEFVDAEVPLGDLDISFYRDDVARRPAGTSRSSTPPTWTSPSTTARW